MTLARKLSGAGEVHAWSKWKLKAGVGSLRLGPDRRRSAERLRAALPVRPR